MSFSKNAGITALTLFASICLGVVGCDTPEGSGTPVPPVPATTSGAGDGQGAGAIVEPRVTATWPGYRLGASPGTWRDRGKLQYVQVPAATKPAADAAMLVDPMRVVVDDRLPSVPLPARPTVTRHDPRTGHLYDVDMDEHSLATLADYLAKAHVAEGNDGEISPAPVDEGIADAGAANVAKSWSDGVDTRSARGIYEFGVAAAPYYRIGLLAKTIGTKTYSCTATFVGTPTSGYFIVTAAHCFWLPGTTTYLDPDFYPRRDGCLQSDNATPIAGCNTQPYGMWDGQGWTMPTYFVNNCIGQSSITRECAANDIAIEEVVRPSGVAFPGAMGFGAFSSSDLTSLTKYNRGYPGCGKTGSPASCRKFTLFGDRNSCPMGPGSFPDGDGWSQLVKMGCDASEGHSGSAIYVNSPGPKVVGVFSSDDQCYAGCTDATPNYIKRITPWWYQVMLSTMGT